MIPRNRLTSLMAALALLFCATAQAQDDGTAATSGPIVVLITIDGFPARALNDPRLPMPTLRMLEATGAHADVMQPINPTVTWPNHTALITGVNAAEHHVMANGLITFPADGGEPKVEPWVPKDELVHARTLYDALAEKGMTTGQVDWVAIYGAKNVRWQFGERPSVDSIIAKDLIARHLITKSQVADFGWNNSSPAWRDEIWTDAAIDILTRHTPNLLLFHLLETDTLQHEYGPLTPAAYAAYAYADSCIARLVRAADKAGLLNRITFILASDHGFASYTHAIRPNVGLVQMGLLKMQNGSLRGDVWAMPEGGEASVFIRNDSQRAALVPKLKAYFEKVPGIEAVYTNKEAQQFGIPAIGSTDQAPDLYIAAKQGYGFWDGTNGPLVQGISASGAHGYINTDPDMGALFVASGAHVRAGVDVGTISNLRVAPTIAKILGVSLPAASQPPLMDVLQ